MLTLANRQWDRQSGTRERLALLAAIGPTLNPHAWGYHPQRDEWYYCGPAAERPHVTAVEVEQEGAESLRLIFERWSLTRDDSFDVLWADGEERIRRSALP